MPLASQLATKTILGLALSFSVQSLASDATSIPSTNSSAEKIPASLLQLGFKGQYYSPFAFVVDKKQRTLTVWEQTDSSYTKVAEFPADLGKNNGEKKSSGDAKTPEGIYFLNSMLEGNGLDFEKYGKRAFVTNYPNFFDQREGKTGSGIWLHAVPDSVPLTRGSKGCVVVRNDAILNLTQYIKLAKTPLLIHEEVDYASLAALKEKQQKISVMIEEWRTAWEKKDIENYIKNYGSEFHSMRMNREQWKRYKTKLNETYQSLNIKLSKPVAYAYKGKAVVRFLQAYTSDQHSDFGEKVLYLGQENGTYKIIGEEWIEETSALAKQEIDTTTTALSSCIDRDKCPATETKHN